MRHINKNQNNDDSSCFHFDDLLCFIDAQPSVSNSTRNSNTDIQNDLNFHHSRDSRGNKSKRMDFDSLLGSTYAYAKTSSKSYNNFDSSSKKNSHQYGAKVLQILMDNSNDEQKISASVDFGKVTVQPMSSSGDSQRISHKRKIPETKSHGIVDEWSRDTNKKIKINTYSSNSRKNSKSEGIEEKLKKKQLARTIESEHDYCLKIR